MKSTIEIARPPDEVFAFVTDPSRFPLWQKDVVAVQLLDGGRFETTRRVGGSERTIVQEITRSHPPRHWEARGVGGPIRANAKLLIEPIEGGVESRLTVTLDFHGTGIGVLLLPVVRRQAAKSAPISYRNLKELLESGK